MIRPEYISLNNWIGALIVDYHEYPLPIYIPDTKWQDWAGDLLNCPPFRGKSIPSPNDSQHWQDWARQLYLIEEMN